MPISADHPAGACNNVEISNTCPGVTPWVRAIGSDSDIALSLLSKGNKTVEIGDYGTATAVAAAATLNTQRGKVTTESLTTAALGLYVLVLTNSKITVDSVVMVSIQNGTNSQATPLLLSVAPANGSVTITVINLAAVLGLNGTLLIRFGIL